MKLKRQSRFHHEVSTGALNDIMFFLLLFFLIVATVANPQVIKLALPSANATESAGTKQVNLTVTADQQYFLGSETKTPIPFANLEAAIRQEINGIENATLVLRVEKTNNVQTLVDVMDLCMTMKVKMVLQTSTQ